MHICADTQTFRTGQHMDAEIRKFKALADPTRLRLAVLLAVEGEVCVCRIAEALGVPDFKVSRHLAVLRAAGWVEARREGTWMHYRLARPATTLDERLQECLRDCLGSHPVVEADLARLDDASCGPDGGTEKAGA
jgi:ArsR family transcriptional regulator